MDELVRNKKVNVLENRTHMVVYSHGSLQMEGVTYSRLLLYVMAHLVISRRCYSKHYCLSMPLQECYTFADGFLPVTFILDIGKKI